MTNVDSSVKCGVVNCPVCDSHPMPASSFRGSAPFGSPSLDEQADAACYEEALRRHIKLGVKPILSGVKALTAPVVSARSVGWTQERFDKEYRGAVVTRDIGGIHHELWFAIGIARDGGCVRVTDGSVDESTGVWIRDSEFAE